MRILRKTAAWIGMLAILLSCCIPAVGADTAVYLRAKQAVSIRVSPSQSARSLGTVKKGTVLRQVSVSGDWVKVKYRTDTGYVPKSAVTKVASVTTDTVKVNGAKMYSSASTKAKVYYTLRQGTSVKVLSSTSKWVKVKYYDRVGYIEKKFFEAKETAAKQPAAVKTVTPKATAAPKNYTVMYVVLDDLVLYKSASAKSTKLKKLDYGTQVRVYGTQGNYAKVIVGSVKGYVPTRFISPAAPHKYVNEEEAPVYTQLQSGSTGSLVKALQERLIELGYLTGSADGKYGTATTNAVKKYQTTVGITASGIATVQTQSSLFSTGAPEAPAPKVNVVATAQTPSGVKNVDWFNGGIQDAFPVGKVVTVTDVDTRITWKEKRTGGWWHADCQPLTPEDTALMLKACGSWSWERRAIWVTIDGVTYAASMNCMPHTDGSDSMPNNNFNGCHCIHFLNSKVHGRACVDTQHQAAVAKAFAAAK